MVFSQEYTTRWNDTDASLHVRPSQILVYMQETAWRQMDAAGQNLDRLREREGLAFILARLSLRFFKPLSPFESITADTWVGEPQIVNFPRFFRVRGADGSIAAEASSTWALMNLQTRLPMSAGAFCYAFPPDEPLDFLTPRRFVRPEQTVEIGERQILYSDIDYNGHMNNTRYPDMLCDYLPQDTVSHVRLMHLNFLREAPYGSRVRIFRGERSCDAGRVFYFRTLNDADEVCLEAEVTTDAEGDGEVG